MAANSVLRTLSVGETLFRRMRRFLRSGGSLSSDDTRSQTLLDMLDQLLYDLYEDQGKEPFGFAMTWWLATLLKHEIEPATHNPSHPMPQVDAILQAISPEPVYDTDIRYGPKPLARSAHLAIARGLRGSIQ